MSLLLKCFCLRLFRVECVWLHAISPDRKLHRITFKQRCICKNDSDSYCSQALIVSHTHSELVPLSWTWHIIDLSFESDTLAATWEKRRKHNAHTHTHGRHNFFNFLLDISLAHFLWLCPSVRKPTASVTLFPGCPRESDFCRRTSRVFAPRT